MKKIRDSIQTELLEKELSFDKFLRKANMGNNTIYVVTKSNSPNTMLEIARLREETFRQAGGGTGEEYDMDDYDDHCYQLVLWDPEDKQIVGGYRFACMSEMCKDGDLLSPTKDLFNFFPAFMDGYLYSTIELGRSFVQPSYQARNNRKGAFSLDNLWDGLAAIAIEKPQIKHLFGKVTMYPSFNRQARNLILFFLKKHFPDNEMLLSPRFPIQGIEKEMEDVKKLIETLYTNFDSSTYEEDLKVLMKVVQTFGETIPPLVKQYMDLSPTMKHFGTSINHHFGDVEETGILVTIEDIYAKKKDRHFNTYVRNSKFSF